MPRIPTRYPVRTVKRFPDPFPTPYPAVETVTIIDSFEDSNLDGWTHDPADYTFISHTVADGAIAIDGTGAFDRAYSLPGDGLGEYFPQGETAHWYYQPQSDADLGNFEADFAMDPNSTASRWKAIFDMEFDRMLLRDGENDLVGEVTSLGAAGDGTWYDIQIERATNDDVVYTLYEDPLNANTELGVISVNNSSHSTFEGVGWTKGGNQSAGAANIIDYIHKE